MSKYKMDPEWKEWGLTQLPLIRAERDKTILDAWDVVLVRINKMKGRGLVQLCL